MVISGQDVHDPKPDEAEKAARRGHAEIDRDRPPVFAEQVLGAADAGDSQVMRSEEVGPILGQFEAARGGLAMQCQVENGSVAAVLYRKAAGPAGIAVDP